MITVINRETAVAAPMYEGFTLSEACDQMVLSVNETANDLMMNILLAEHAYLYENACEIEYVTEGKITEAGAKVKEMALNAIKATRAAIAGIWEKLKSWAFDFINGVKDAFVKAGITKGTFSKAIDYYCSSENEKKDVKADGWVKYAAYALGQAKSDKEYINAEKLKGGLKEEDLYRESGKYYNEVKDACFKDEAGDVTKEQLNWALDDIFTNGIAGEIKEAAKAADDTLKKYETVIKNENVDKEELAGTIGNIKEALKSNSIVCKDKVKIYHSVIASQAAVAKAIIKIYRPKQMEEIKEDIKKAPENAKKAADKAVNDTKAAANKAGEDIKNAAKKAGEGIKNAPANAKEAAKKAGEDIKGAAGKAKEGVKKIFPTGKKNK